MSYCDQCAKLINKVSDLEDRLREAEKKVHILTGERDFFNKSFTECHADLQKLEKEREAYREALLPFAEDYFSNKEEAELNKMETRHHGGAGYDACIYFADVKKAQEALKDPGLKGDA